MKSFLNKLKENMKLLLKTVNEYSVYKPQKHTKITTPVVRKFCVEVVQRNQWKWSANSTGIK